MTNDEKKSKNKTIISSKIIGSEPILNSEEPKWLIIKEQLVQPDKIKIKKTLSEEQIYDREVLFQLQDPDLWQCQKCGCIIKLFEKPTYCDKKIGGCGRTTDFKKYTDKINLKRWKLTRWKDIPKDEISMIETYDDLKILLKKCIVFSEDIFYDLYSLWIIASYKYDSFNTICFLLFLGFIESGKTRGLDLLRELGYRMIHTTGVTFPAICRYTDKYNAAILVDELDNKIHKKTEDGRRYLDFLKPSYRKGSIYAVADNNDQDGTKEYSNYGFKAFAGERGGTDAAFLSRCITFRMEQAYPEIPDLSYIQDEIDRIQNILLNYRYKFNDPDPLPLDFDMKGRDRELFGCLIQTANNIGIDCQDMIDFIKERKQDIIDDMQQTDDYLILNAIYNIQTGQNSNMTLDGYQDTPEILSYSDIAEECGWDPNSDEGKKKRQSIGYILHKKFHLKTKRYGQGMVLTLNDGKNKRKLNNYYKRFKII